MLVLRAAALVFVADSVYLGPPRTCYFWEWGLNLKFDLADLPRGQEMVDQEPEVLPTFTQRRQRQRDDIEAIEKVFAETSLLLLFFESLRKTEIITSRFRLGVVRALARAGVRRAKARTTKSGGYYFGFPALPQSCGRPGVRVLPNPWESAYLIPGLARNPQQRWRAHFL